MKIPRIVALLSLLLGILTGVAAAKSWRISDFQDEITVANDGSAIVQERITLSFVGEWHGIHRNIAIEYPGPNGSNYELYIDIRSVADGEGNAPQVRVFSTQR